MDKENLNPEDKTEQKDRAGFLKKLARLTFSGARLMPALAVVLVVTTIVLYLTVGPGAAGGLKLEPVTEKTTETTAAGPGDADLALDEYTDMNRGAYWDYLIESQAGTDETSTNAEPAPTATSASEPTQPEASEPEPTAVPTQAPVVTPEVTPPPIQMDSDGVVMEPLETDQFTKDAKVVYVSAFEANIRTAPRTDVDILHTATMGDKLERTGYGEYWSQISLDGGIVGYVYNELISETVIYKPASLDTESDKEETGQAPAPDTEFKKDKTDIYVKSFVANIRSGPGTDTAILQKAGMGDKFHRTAVSAEWSRIELASGKTGYIFNDLISTKAISKPTPTPSPVPVNPSPTPVPEKEPAKEIEFKADEKEVYVKANVANVRSGPGTDTAILQKATWGDKFSRTGVSAEWSRIVLADGKTGYIFNDLISTEPVSKPKPVENDPAGSGLSEQQKKDIVDLAKSMLGVKYVYGGAKPGGFDCSGLTTYIYKTLHGITLPRSAKDQAFAGTKVSSSQITVGDIICFDWDRPYGVCDHVGIYIGNGQYIHATRSAGKVKLSEVNFSRNPIVSIRRIIP